ncbi:unnamed protein product, partial [marine sediment metagenome]
IIPEKSSYCDDIPDEHVVLPADPRKQRMPLERLHQHIKNGMGWAGDEDQRAARTMRAACRWLEGRYGNCTPFFLAVDTFDPHEPWDAPRYYVDAYDRDYDGDRLVDPAYEPAEYATESEIRFMRCLYAAKLTMVDRWIGYLLAGIERLGLRDDTVIFFTSDHGFYHGEHGLIGKVLLDREDVICGRWPLYATITHAPLLIRLPGMTVGKQYSAFCQPADLMPTVLEVFDRPIPQGVQGSSLLPLLRGESAASRGFAITSATYVQDKQVRSPTSFRTE